MGRSPCCDKIGLKKGPWTPEEDLKLIQYIELQGPGNWRTLPKNAGLQRCGKSCRLRWTNYLRSDIKRGRFSFEEEEAIIQFHSILGNKWSAIAARLPGRTDNEIKNYWNTHIKKRLLRMGIDPVTHSPRLDLLDLSSLLSSTQLNLSSLLGLQTLVNPELLRLVITLLSSNQENLENPQMIFQQLLQENQPFSTQMGNQTPVIQSNQFQTPIDHQEIPNMGQFSTNLMTSTSCQNLQENLSPSTSLNEKVVTLPNNGYGSGFDYLRTDLSDNSSSFESLKNNHNFTFDSVTSTPLNSSPQFINGSNIEDEREISCCSNLLKFEIPEGLLHFDDFM